MYNQDVAISAVLAISTLLANLHACGQFQVLDHTFITTTLNDDEGWVFFLHIQKATAEYLLLGSKNENTGF